MLNEIVNKAWFCRISLRPSGCFPECSWFLCSEPFDMIKKILTNLFSRILTLSSSKVLTALRLLQTTKIQKLITATLSSILSFKSFLTNISYLSTDENCIDMFLVGQFYGRAVFKICCDCWPNWSIRSIIKSLLLTSTVHFCFFASVISSITFQWNFQPNFNERKSGKSM